MNNWCSALYTSRRCNFDNWQYGKHCTWFWNAQSEFK